MDWHLHIQPATATNRIVLVGEQVHFCQLRMVRKKKSNNKKWFNLHTSAIVGQAQCCSCSNHVLVWRLSSVSIQSKNCNDTWGGGWIKEMTFPFSLVVLSVDSAPKVNEAINSSAAALVANLSAKDKQKDKSIKTVAAFILLFSCSSSLFAVCRHFFFFFFLRSHVPRDRQAQLNK